MTPLFRRKSAAVSPSVGRAKAPPPRDAARWLSRTLQSALTRLDKAAPGSARQISDFVLTGSPASVLKRLSGITGGPAMLGVVTWHVDAETQALRAVLAQLGDLAPDAVVRWGQVAEAAATASSYLYGLDPVAGARWPEALVLQIATAYETRGARGRPGTPPTVPVYVDVLERALTAAGAAPSALLVAAFREAAGGRVYSNVARDTLTRMAGYGDAVARHADVLRRAIRGQGANGRLLGIGMLAKVPDAVLILFADELAELATSTSSQVRKAAGPLAARCGGALVEPLKVLIATAKPEQRMHALRVLWSVADDATRAWAREQAEADRAPSVRALAREWAEGGAAPAHDPLPAEQPRPMIDWRARVTPETRNALATIWTEVNTATARYNAQNLAYQAQWQAQLQAQTGRLPSQHWFKPSPLLGDRWVDDVCKELDRVSPPEPAKSNVRHQTNGVLQQRLAAVGLPPAGVVRVLNHTGDLVDAAGSLSWAAALLIQELHDRTGRPSLLELSTMLDEMGLDGGRLVCAKLVSSWSTPLGTGWPHADVAPFVAAHLELVTAVLTNPGRDHGVSLLAAYRALATLPTLPRTVADTLFSIALTGFKSERRPAQDALASVPDAEVRIITALADGKADVRAEAAHWLARLRSEAAVPALEVAVAKEKQDVAKGAMLDALQAVGRPVERYLDRDALAAQAAAAVAKGLPKELSWLHWAALPEVRWADSGAPVALTTVQWLTAQAVRAKAPEPNAVLRKYCGMFETRSREALGQYLLEAWLTEDVRPVDPQTAMAKATQQAQSLHQWMQTQPQAFAEHPLRGQTVAQMTAAHLPTCLREPAGSAIGAKGVLAVAGACAGEGAAAPVGRYLNDWYGMRAAQGKALIAMLAWIDHPSATQLMLSVGSRFRTKSFQEEATRQAEALAERKGWTVAELADRTIPTVGLDETGTLELSYGERAFTAVLTPDLTLELHSPEGTRITALPTPRQTDDADRAREAKKALATARKELKSVVTLQTDRFYEALCTERCWALEDWDRYLARHPIVGHLVQRLVWSATTDNGVTVFRPLDDGTLTDADDAEVSVPPDALVRIAHDTNLDGITVATWNRHLADYEITPLFQQFGKGTYALPEGRGAETEIAEFRGHLTESFRLRGRVMKLGYTRGQSEDGGWFFTYEKRFPTLGLSAVIRFSGSPLPEESRTVALETLSFERHVQGYVRPALRLSDVPAVLLSEAYSDLRMLAADGSGYDPDWERKVAP